MSGRGESGPGQTGWVKELFRFLLPTAVYELLCLMLLFTRKEYLFFMMAWNVFLGLLPLLFMIAAERVRRRALTALFGILWLLFLPNAFYLLTDLIHVPGGMSFREAGTVAYSVDLQAWTKLLVIGLGAVMGTAMGLESLHRFRMWVTARKGTRLSWCGVMAVSLLCGTGIYIGRFLRFNSWDALHISRILQRAAETFDVFTLQFIGIFSLGIALLTVFYELLRKDSSVAGEGP